MREFLIKEKNGGILGYLVRFAMTGAIGTGVHYLLLIILVELVYFTPATATLFGFIGGAITNYLLSNYFVFNAGKLKASSVLKFICMVFIGICLNQLVFLLVDYYVPYLLAQIVATCVVFMSNFLISKYWVCK